MPILRKYSATCAAMCSNKELRLSAHTHRVTTTSYRSSTKNPACDDLASNNKPASAGFLLSKHASDSISKRAATARRAYPNLMVQDPGAYRFGDYWKLGLVCMALYFIIATVLVPIVWPF